MVDSKPSKSALKREVQALQKLGEQLIELQPGELERLSVDDRLLDAVLEARKIRSNGALRRQKQLIGKLMRQVDAEAIRAGVAAIQDSALADKRVFAASERWRDRIADEGCLAVDAFRAETGSHDDGLELLVSELGRANSDKARRTVRRKIFRAVNGILATALTDDRISQ